MVRLERKTNIFTKGYNFKENDDSFIWVCVHTYSTHVRLDHGKGYSGTRLPVPHCIKHHTILLCLSESVNLCAPKALVGILAVTQTYIYTHRFTTKPPSVYTTDKTTATCGYTDVVYYNRRPQDHTTNKKTIDDLPSII